MSRELLGLFGFAILCIVLSPFYKENRSVQRYSTVPPLKVQDTIVTEHKKTIVLLSDTFLPGSYAGSELSAYETMRYLRSRGHTCIAFIKHPKAKEYDGFKIYQYDVTNEFCKSQLLESDVIFFQMKDDPENFKIIDQRNKPIFIMIHVVNCYHWLLPQNVAFPVSIVYNSHMTQDTLPTIHDNMRMIPYVNLDPFISLRDYTLRSSVVCLINCNKNKGSSQFYEMVYAMPEVQFLAVKGGYANQDLKDPPPPNLTYMENQKDVRVVFRNIGILVMPSKNETWGRTAVEAMASGVPVIHSEAGGLVECVGGAGILCQRDDIDAWCQAIRRLVGDPAYKERIRQHGFKRIEEIQIEQRRGRQELAIKIEAI
jgi:hypothetical protein